MKLRDGIVIHAGGVQWGVVGMGDNIIGAAGAPEGERDLGSMLAERL